jgi:hypothetical protein
LKLDSSLRPAWGQSDGGSRPFIEETETGIVVNRASGFVSEWETFDLIGPGVGYGHFAITAADADGEIWTQDPGGIIYGADFQVSANGIAWSAGYAYSAFTPIGIFAFPPNSCRRYSGVRHDHSALYPLSLADRGRHVRLGLRRREQPLP